MLSTLNLDPILVYIFGVILCSGIFWLTCRFMIQIGRFGVVRMILLGSVLLSFVLPAIKIGVFEGVSTPLNIEMQTNIVASVETTVTEMSFWESLEILTVMLTIYIGVLSILLVKFIYGIFRLKFVRHNGFVNLVDGVKVVVSKSVKSPYSFGKTIFINDSLNGCERDMVLRHELEHVRLRHSLDNIFMEIVCSVFWFNPFFYLVKRTLNEVHEFEADSAVVGSGFNVADYKHLIFRQIGCDYPEIASGLVFSLTKKRIIMLSRTKRSKMLRMLAILPSVLMCLCLVSFVERTPQEPTLLILCDGKEVTKAQIDEIDPSTIDSMVVLKDGVNDKYPQFKGADQAIIITTKKDGDIGKQKGGDSAVVLYDGKRITITEMAAIAPESIKSMTVVKDGLERLYPQYKGASSVTVIVSKAAKGIVSGDNNTAEFSNSIILYDGKRITITEMAAIAPESIKNVKVTKSNAKTGAGSVIEISSKDGVVLSLDTVILRQYGSKKDKAINAMAVGDRQKQDEPVVVAETMALFEGKPGQSAFAMWCMENIKWPKDATKEMEGRSIVSFVIEKDGSMSNVKLVRTGGYKSFDDAALEVVKSCNVKWTPATNNGETVRLMLHMPVAFKSAPVTDKM